MARRRCFLTRLPGPVRPRLARRQRNATYDPLPTPLRSADVGSYGRGTLVPKYLHCTMGTVVNLRIERKRAKRRQAGEQAAATRAAHGRPAAERNQSRAQRDKARTDLENHRIETENGNEI